MRPSGSPSPGPARAVAVALIAKVLPVPCCLRAGDLPPHMPSPAPGCPRGDAVILFVGSPRPRVMHRSTPGLPRAWSGRTTRRTSRTLNYVVSDDRAVRRAHAGQHAAGGDHLPRGRVRPASPWPADTGPGIAMVAAESLCDRDRRRLRPVASVARAPSVLPGGRPPPSLSLPPTAGVAFRVFVTCAAAMGAARWASRGGRGAVLA